MNALTLAFNKLNQHIEAVTTSIKSHDELREELMAMDKEELVDKLMAIAKVSTVKIEDVVRPILEDDDCRFLTYDQIASAICKKVPGAKTSSKSIASYASKYPAEKGWNVVKRVKQNDLLAQLLAEATTVKGG